MSRLNLSEKRFTWELYRCVPLPALIVIHALSHLLSLNYSHSGDMYMLFIRKKAYNVPVSYVLTVLGVFNLKSHSSASFFLLVLRKE